MYSLDVNFLKERGGPQQAGPVRQRPQGSIVPIAAGIAVALIPLLGAGGILLVLNQQSAELQKQGEQLDITLGNLKAKQDEIKKINDQIAQLTGETKGLASVFNQVKPWSAMLQDIRSRIPTGVQIRSMQQADVTTTATPSSPAITTTQLEISGTARSFNEVNDFLLTLQRSPFFNKDKTQLVAANLIKNSTPVESPSNQNNQSVRLSIDLPDVIEYRIQTALSETPAVSLIQQLERNGALGLVTRLRTLQKKGVIQ